MITTEDQYRFELVDDDGMCAYCLTCGTRIPIDDGQSLRDLNERAQEHAEVCR